MFTGIVAGQGTVRRLETRPDGALLLVDAGPLVADLPHGGSLAVNGVCLTATRTGELGPGQFLADVIGETLARTTLGTLAEGDVVNLERCVPAGGRLDGHVVQGHVDGTGTVAAREDLGDWERVRVAVPAELAPFVAEKGSIAVDGVSLTVTAVSEPGAAEPWFEVGLIPATLAETTLGRRPVGSAVNLEADVLAKYAQRLLAFARTESTPQGPAAGPATGEGA
ncbi:riboflavin synthase [Kocuria sp. M1R5S2]|uniref:riboflavin synthase n=1 Tax=Kocuria rhizosphaerae TaxID=3376285 RepID=UPI0037AB7A24